MASAYSGLMFVRRICKDQHQVGRAGLRTQATSHDAYPQASFRGQCCKASLWLHCPYGHTTALVIPQGHAAAASWHCAALPEYPTPDPT